MAVLLVIISFEFVVFVVCYLGQSQASYSSSSTFGLFATAVSEQSILLCVARLSSTRTNRVEKADGRVGLGP